MEQISFPSAPCKLGLPHHDWRRSQGAEYPPCAYLPHVIVLALYFRRIGRLVHWSQAAPPPLLHNAFEGLPGSLAAHDLSTQERYRLHVGYPTSTLHPQE